MTDYSFNMNTHEEDFHYPLTNVTTGGDDQRRYLYYQLKISMRTADAVDLIVSFLMESGVRMILNDLKDAVSRGARIRILTGNYLGITQPSALYLLRKELGNQIDLRFYNEADRSFHAKSYIFHFKDRDEIFIGSSNVSKSALTSGIEWNFRFSTRTDKEDYDKFYNTFEDLFEQHSIRIDDEELKRYSANWHRPAVYKDFGRYGDAEEIGLYSANKQPDDNSESQLAQQSHSADGVPKEGKIHPLFFPRGVQIEALYALEQCRKDGASRALVQAATGVGKTYIAAFDSQKFQRVLFVAHREEILKQAADAFRNVRGTGDFGFFGNNRHDTKGQVIFAMVESLGKETYLKPDYFRPDDFDYLCVDEMHHGVTAQYRKIMDYFHPRFMLGLTATPERMDGRDVYALCDYNVPYELNLKDAINKGMLVPFHYYGIYDDTDYSKLHIVKGHYDTDDLDKAYIGNARRYDLIYRYYEKYARLRAIGFCSSRNHAVDIAREFCSRGVKAAAVISGEQGEYCMERTEALSRLRSCELQIIFSVDMFNEGVDVPSLDLVLFLRPTESPVIFLQQLGRGLRRAKNKPYLNVLDFIGNYRKAGAAPQLLRGDGGKSRGGNIGEKDDPSMYPDDCIVDFDMRLVDLFKKMQEKSRGIGEQIDAEFDRIRDQIGHVPTRMELFSEMDDAIYTLCLAHTAQNPYRKYLEYLHRRHLLTMEEQKIYDGIGREFLNLVSTTSMTKVYKMPVLASFLTENGMRTEVTDDQILKTWKEFFNQGTNWKDLLSGRENTKSEKDITIQDYRRISDRQHLQNIKKNPVHFLIASGKGLFVEKEGYAIAVRDDLQGVFQNPVFQSHYRDIIAYRTVDYYRRRYAATKENAVFLFEKPVDKSLLKDGFAIPKSAIPQLLRETGISLPRGGKATIKIELEGRIYAAQLTSLDFSRKYQDQERVQIRYSRDSEICQRLNELYTDENPKKEGKTVKIYSSGSYTLRLVPQNV